MQLADDSLSNTSNYKVHFLTTTQSCLLEEVFDIYIYFFHQGSYDLTTEIGPVIECKPACPYQIPLWTAYYKVYKSNDGTDPALKDSFLKTKATVSHHLMPVVQSVSHVQFSSVTQSCLTLCDPMNRSTPGLPVHHQLLEFTQTHAHRVSDVIQPSRPLLSPSPPAPNPSQHQGLIK